MQGEERDRGTGPLGNDVISKNSAISKLGLAPSTNNNKVFMVKIIETIIRNNEINPLLEFIIPFYVFCDYEIYVIIEFIYRQGISINT